MQLSDERIKEFQKIARKGYRKELTWEEVNEGAHNLVDLFKVFIDVLKS